MKKMLMLFIMIATISSISNAQSIYFNFTNGTNGQYPLIDVQHIDFSSTDMQMHLINGTLVSWNTTAIISYKYLPYITALSEVPNIAIGMEVSPNPSNGDVQIKYALPVHQKLEMAIYDLQGQLIDQRKIGEQDSGSYTQQWHATTKGLYVIKLSTEQQVISKKVVIQ
jgi:hypothetical protein